MSRKIKTANDVVEVMEELVNAVWDGDVSPQAGAAIQQAVGRSLNTVCLKLKYAKQRGVKPDIDFLK